jgi:hypothetical protein
MDKILDSKQIEQFITDGFIRVDKAFSKELAEDARRILWKDLGVSADDRTTWTKPLIRLGMYTQKPFVQAANTDVLLHAFDQLIGEGRWIPRQSMGTFPVRFPSDEDPGDTGWHVDASFPAERPESFSNWRVNIKSRGRALLMLFLFSDVSEMDAPTRIRVGSHFDVAQVLAGAGDQGLSFMELAGKLSGFRHRKEVLATGEAGTVYLCHPFLVHAAQSHHGKEPRFLAQPPLELKEELVLERPEEIYTPLEESIRLALKG